MKTEDPVSGGEASPDGDVPPAGCGTIAFTAALVIVLSACTLVFLQVNLWIVPKSLRSRGFVADQGFEATLIEPTLIAGLLVSAVTFGLVRIVRSDLPGMYGTLRCLWWATLVLCVTPGLAFRLGAILYGR